MHLSVRVAVFGVMIYMSRAHTTDDFIKKARLKHGTAYDYSLVRYKNCSLNVEIICHQHGKFHQRPDHHLAGSGCPKCADMKTADQNKMPTFTMFQKFKERHDNFYSYPNQSEVKTLKDKIIITCPIHGDFLQVANYHMRGSGCVLCSHEKTSKRQKLDHEFLLKRLRSINANKYEFDISNYETLHSVIEVFCFEHQIKFKARVGNFLKGKIGCPCCKTKSKGERVVAKILTDHNVLFEHEKTFANLVSETGNKLRFDFYLPQSNILIEYDGAQHFEPIERFGGELGLQNTRKNDQIKNNFCQDNAIQLIRIRYDENVLSVLRSCNII